MKIQQILKAVRSIQEQLAVIVAVCRRAQLGRNQKLGKKKVLRLTFGKLVAEMTERGFIRSAPLEKVCSYVIPQNLCVKLCVEYGTFVGDIPMKKFLKMSTADFERLTFSGKVGCRVVREFLDYCGIKWE